MSKFIEWTNDLSVGVDELDAQHQSLIEIINELHEAIHNRKGSAISREVLTKLKEYTRVHFAVEESLMRIFKYPRYKEHVKEHAILIDQIIELEDKLDHNKTSISFELLHFLKNWLSKHIINSDSDYGPFFTEKGIVSEKKKTGIVSTVKELFGHLKFS